jgi:catechol 2,3-dioxygenase-like lactoylglutathione lyase family enzyme
MIKSKIGHMQIIIDPKNMPFYKDLFTFLGWSILCDEPGMLGVGDEQGTSLWLSGPLKENKNDYDAAGMNHLGISVPNQSDVDETVAYLQQHAVKALFETPRHRPDFCSSPDQTYYQVMFESPDRLLFEVVYTGPLAK